MRRPVRARRLAAPLDPLAAMAALRRLGPVVALETTRPSSDHGRQTIVAGAPLAAFTWHRGKGRLTPLRAEVSSWRLPPVDSAPTPFRALELALAAAAWPPVEGGSVPLEDGAAHALGDLDAPPLGAFGFFGYECAAPPDLPRLEPFPDAWFLLCDTVVHWPEPGAVPILWSASGSTEPFDSILAELEASRSEAARLLALATCGGPPPRLDAPPRTDRAPRSELVQPEALPSDLAFDDYERRFLAARAALARGDSYQLCLTYPIALRFDGDALLLYARLRLENPAPFSAFVSAPFGAIASSSPERFLRVGRDGRVEARPMKGTAARAADAGERERAARELVASEKARAENLMIADLLRNDLGRVCRLGSVRAARPALLEEHATVLQLVSVIEGELLPGRTRADLLASAFPPGSMTGAPKTRSIELLRDLELEPRGPYSGALGYVAADGRMDLSVLIRAVLLAGGSARVNVGGGIVWDSTARGEFEESRLKAEPLLRALASATAADRGGDGALSGCATSERAATARAPARDASARSAS